MHQHMICKAAEVSAPCCMSCLVCKSPFCMSASVALAKHTPWLTQNLGLQRSGSGSDSEAEAFKDEKRKRPEVEVPSLKVINTLHCLMCA